MGFRRFRHTLREVVIDMVRNRGFGRSGRITRVLNRNRDVFCSYHERLDAADMEVSRIWQKKSSRCEHGFRRERIGQARGASVGSPVLQRTYIRGCGDAGHCFLHDWIYTHIDMSWWGRLGLRSFTVAARLVVASLCRISVIVRMFRLFRIIGTMGRR